MKPTTLFYITTFEGYFPYKKEKYVDLFPYYKEIKMTAMDF